MQLAEKYRPRNVDGIVGQPKAVARVKELGRRGYGGRAYLISGPSGTGKTTIARIIADLVAAPLAIEETNAADCTIADIRRIELEWHTTCLAPAGCPNGRAYIFNEVHLMRGSIVSRFLTTLEAIPSHVVVIFTTTTEGMSLFSDESDALPFASRCDQIKTTGEGFQRPAAEYLRQCCQLEGIDLDPARCAAKAKELKGNLRAMFQAADTGDI